MNSLSINLNGDGAFDDLAEADIIHLQNARIQVVVLAGGMTSGRPSVTLRIDLPDGKSVVAETSARLFVSAGRLIVGRFPDLFDDAVPGRH